jgi:hypothetical protein
MLWNIEIYTPFTSGTAMLLHINGKLKSSLVVYFKICTPGFRPHGLRAVHLYNIESTFHKETSCQIQLHFHI